MPARAWLVAAFGAAALSAAPARAETLAADPFVQQGEKLASAEVKELAEQGSSVAISADGTTAVVGAPAYKTFTGAAFVYVRSGSSWTQQAKLEGAGASKFPHQGASVAISADGNTVLVGAPENPGEHEEYFGATYVFVREGTTWHEQAKLLATTGATEKGAQGSSVALSASGDTALVGAMDNEYVSGEAPGAAFVFTRSASSWSQQGGALIGKHKAVNVQEGTSVALSAEGTTALVGGPREEAVSSEPETGAAWVFTLGGGKWSEQAELPVGTGVQERTGFGQSVALSGTGDTALVGGPGPEHSNGAAWVYTRSGPSWSQQGERLLGEDATTEASEGRSVALSEDGSTALVGGYRDDTSVGAAWAFVRSGTSWSEQQKLVGTGGVGGFLEQGAAVALSADGLTALVGGPGDTSQRGAAWVFTRNPPSTGGGGHEGGGGTTGGGNVITTTTTTGSSTAGIASTAAAIEALQLGCGGHKLSLNDVYIRGSRVLLQGSAARSFAGSKVKILFDEKRQVATATVLPDGQYSTTAPLPPARIRSNLDTRYTAEIGSLRSLHVKLTRRLELEPPRASGTTITLSGVVTLPLTKPVAPVVVEQQLECGHTTIAKRFTPPAGGRFHITLTVPAAARAAIYQLTSYVAANAHATRHGFKTYSLPLPVAIG